MEALAESIRRAYWARSALHADPLTGAYRLFHGYAEGGDGLSIDLYGDVLVMEGRGGDSRQFAVAASALCEIESFSSIVVKRRGGAPCALLGTLPNCPVVVLEAGLKYSVETWAPRNPGLYLDARPARSWLGEHCEGLRILNLYSHSGALGVAAMAGKALSVIHVDTQKRALRRCAINHKLNGQRTDARDLLCLDVATMLRKAATSGRRFGGVILDPPPPPRARLDSPSCAGLPLIIELAPLVAKVVAPGGWALCFFHHDPRSWEQLEALMSAGFGRQSQVIWRSRSGVDFPEAIEERDLRLSVFALL